MDDLLNILSNSNKDIDNQKLMDYVSGKLSNDQQHELESQMADSEMLNDAVEGLSQVKDPQRVNSYVEQLNANLRGHIGKKHKRIRKWKDEPWVYLAIVIILALIVICFIVIKGHLDGGKVKTGEVSVKESSLTYSLEH